MNAKTALIIVNWQTVTDTVNCLNSILSSDEVPELIYVIDNKSDLNCLAKIIDEIKESPFFEQMIFIQTLRNLGYAAAINLALRDIIKNTDVNYIWLLNNDTQVCQDTLSVMKGVLASNEHNGLISCSIIDSSFGNRSNIGGAQINSKLAIATHIKSSVRFAPDYLIGCNILLRSQVLDDIGLLPEDYFMYYEDSDWQKYVHHKWRIVCTDKTEIFHNTSKRRNISYYYYKNRAAILYVKKHHPMYVIPAFIVHALIILFDKPQTDRLKYAYEGLLHGARGITGEMNVKS